MIALLAVVAGACLVGGFLGVDTDTRVEPGRLALEPLARSLAAGDALDFMVPADKAHPAPAAPRKVDARSSAARHVRAGWSTRHCQRNDGGTDMTLLDDLMLLEDGFWHASENPGYYREHMRDDGLAVFSGSVMSKKEAEDSTSSDASGRWTDVRIERARVVEIADDVAALVYEGSAARAGQPYRAMCASVYARRNGTWQMVLHQQSQVQDT